LALVKFSVTSFTTFFVGSTLSLFIPNGTTNGSSKNKNYTNNDDSS
jgi:hypothetical protein